MSGKTETPVRFSSGQFWIGWTLGFVLLAWCCSLIARSIKVPEAKTMLQVYSSASERYHETYGQWPQTIQDFTNNARGITFIYSKALLKSDAWGNPFEYEPFDAARGYGVIRSFGQDGKPGGDRWNADLEMHFPTAR